jgi:hypothetical protein
VIEVGKYSLQTQERRMLLMARIIKRESTGLKTNEAEAYDTKLCFDEETRIQT